MRTVGTSRPSFAAMAASLPGFFGLCGTGFGAVFVALVGTRMSSSLSLSSSVVRPSSSISGSGGVGGSV